MDELIDPTDPKKMTDDMLRRTLIWEQKLVRQGGEHVQIHKENVRILRDEIARRESEKNQ